MCRPHQRRAASSDGYALGHTAVGDAWARGGGKELVGKAAHLEGWVLVARSNGLLDALHLLHKLAVEVQGCVVLNMGRHAQMSIIGQHQSSERGQRRVYREEIAGGES
jgi:hypothetical protein